MTSWNDIHTERAWGSWPDGALVRFVKGSWMKGDQFLSLESPQVLELGYGAGGNLRLFGEEGVRASGIDIAPAARDRSIRRLNLWFPRAGNPASTFDLRVGDVRQLPWPDSYFDLVVDMEAITCLEFDAAKEAYDEAWRVASQGCFLFIRTFAEGTFSGEGAASQERMMVLPTDGPLKGTPPFRMTALHDIEELLGRWSIASVEVESRTEGSERLISELIVTATKQVTDVFNK
jgi:SAM-dependent methyltransferase